jgi:hypothetical protein
VRRILFALAPCVLVLAACSPGSKLVEPYQDSPVGNRNNQPADVFTMPDGFSNGATKCIAPGIRAAVLFHQDSNYGGLALVQDPHCQ